MTALVATSAHEIAESPPIQIEPGDEVTVMDEPATHWTAFVLVATTAGGTGWVPTRYLSSSAPGPATVLTAYDTTELPTRAGDRLEVLVRDDESEWHWCRNVSGREGWVPVETIGPA